MAKTAPLATALLVTIATAPAQAQTKADLDAASAWAMARGCDAPVPSPGSTGVVQLGDEGGLLAEGTSRFSTTADESGLVIVIQGTMDIGGPQPAQACVVVDAPFGLVSGGEAETRDTAPIGGSNTPEHAAAVFRAEIEGMELVMAAGSGRLSVEPTEGSRLQGSVSFTGPAWDGTVGQVVPESDVTFSARATFEAVREEPSGEAVRGEPEGVISGGQPPVAAPPTASVDERVRRAFDHYVECAERMRTGDPMRVAPDCIAPHRLRALVDGLEDPGGFLKSTRAMELTLVGFEEGPSSIELRMVGALDGVPTALRVAVREVEGVWLADEERLDVKSGALVGPDAGSSPQFELREAGRVVLDSRTGVWRRAANVGYPTLVVEPFFHGPEIQIDNLRLETPSQASVATRSGDQLAANPRWIGVRYRAEDGPTRVRDGELVVHDADRGRMSGSLRLTVESGAAGALEAIEVELDFVDMPLESRARPRPSAP